MSGDTTNLAKKKGCLRNLGVGTALFLGLMVIGALLPDSDSGSSATTTTRRTTTTQPAELVFDDLLAPLVIVEGEYGPEWPFTVSTAMLHCEHDAVWVEALDTLYPINGTAKSRLGRTVQPGAQVQPLETIWKPHPDPSKAEAGIRMSISPFIRYGLQICQESSG